MTHELIITTLDTEEDGLEHRLLKFLFSRRPEFGWANDIKYEVRSGQQTHCTDGVLFDNLPFFGKIMVAGCMTVVQSETVDKTITEVLAERMGRV